MTDWTTARVTPEMLAELRRLAEAATPGPWATAAFQLVIDVARRIDVGMCGHRDDAAYIAAANPAVVLALLDERDALAADADKWQRAALTLQGDRDALTDERDSLSWQVEALRAERDARSSERDALATKVERVRALPAKHPAGGWYMMSMRDVLAALDEEPQPDLPDWVRTKTEAVRTAQLQQHERDQEMQQLQQVGTIQKIIERGYDEGV